MIASEIRDSKVLENAFAMRVAFNGDRDQWKDFCQLFQKTDKKAEAKSVEDDTERFKSLVRSGGLR